MDMAILAKSEEHFMKRCWHNTRIVGASKPETGDWKPVRDVYLNPNKTDQNLTSNTLDKAA
jgi:hypothetical protein